MMVKLLLAWCVMAACVAIHATGLAIMIRRINRRSALTDLRLLAQSWALIRIAGLLILLHLIEISAWAALYFLFGGMPDLSTAFYFSSVTYTTVGYGDVVLPRDWNFVGGIEALTGILMCGWSTGFFFLIISRLYAAHKEQQQV
jgi:hypothetical protein